MPPVRRGDACRERAHASFWAAFSVFQRMCPASYLQGMIAVSLEDQFSTMRILALEMPDPNLKVLHKMLPLLIEAPHQDVGCKVIVHCYIRLQKYFESRLFSSGRRCTCY
uniref:Uncharacterized protein n=1 Tax=Arundo donax TaxID=35708 RepID=A0A0A9G052_ARUDO